MRAGGSRAPGPAQPESGAGETGVRVEAGEAVPREVDQVGGDLVLLEPARVDPPLPGERDHADEHLGVDRRRARVETARS